MRTITEIDSKYNDHKARAALTEARSTLEKAILELDRYASRLEDASTPRDKANIMNWTLSHLACNLIPNLRLDLIANAQAEFVRAIQTEGAES